jgi:hypothetical protein
MIWFQMGTLCDLSLSWIHLMVLEYVVEKLEWHPKLNVLWVFKRKPRVWVVGFGLVDSLAFVPFNLHISFHLFHLVFCSWINPQTFGTRLKWSWLNKTLIFDHFSVDSTSHLHTLYCKRFVRLRVLIKTHINVICKNANYNSAENVKKHSSKRSLPTCHHCSITGHIWLKCPQL